ncbi:MAG TPA: alpha/beta fold hydrolase [Gemmatimonadaceae bacterium]|nr:alpha/beta fold hydrolase [Gemmatimonadaceae bacterium]
MSERTAIDDPGRGLPGHGARGQELAARGEARPPVLLIHGLFAGAWVLAEWQRRLAARGYPAYAIDLRGRPGGRPVPDLGRVPFAAYLEDAMEAARRLAAETGRNPIVIGHSLGGLIAQKLAEADVVTAAVLVCPAPPRGIPLVGLTLYARLLKYLPAILGARPVLPSRADADAVILNAVPPDERAAGYARLVPDSGRAGRDILLGVPVDAARVRCPVLVVSASEDRFVPPRIAHHVAKRYRAPFREYFGNGHFLPGEPGWETALDEIEHWLDQTLALGGHDSPGIIRLQELAALRGKTVELAFRDGHVVRARVVSVDFEPPAEIVYEVLAVLEVGPPHLADVKPGRVAAAPLDQIRQYTPARG